MQRRPLSRVHDRLALGLAILVPASALPLASNRSNWWLVWTMILAFLAALYVLRAARLEPGHKLRIATFGWALAVALLLPLWAWLQTMPLAFVLPEGLLGVRDGLGGLTGAAISVEPGIAMVGILRFIGYLLLFALVLEVATRGERVLKLATIVFAGVVVQAVWAIVALQLLDDFSFWGPKTAYQGTATGTFINRNSLATFLGFGIILGIGILVERTPLRQIRMSRPQGRLMRLGFAGAFILLGMVFQFIALLATQSRLGLGATLAAVAVTVLILRYRGGVPAGRVLVETLVLLVAAAGIIAVLTGGDGVMNRVLYSEMAGDTRFALYDQTIGMIAHRPLTGFGMDSFAFAFEAFRAPPLTQTGNFDLSHNSYLMLWAEFGLVIGSIPPLLLTAACVVLWRRLADPAGYPGLALAGIGVLVLGGLHSLGDFSLEIPANVYLFITILGMGLGLRSRKSPKTAAPEPVRDTPVTVERIVMTVPVQKAPS
jgi:O-antigen ligase